MSDLETNSTEENETNMSDENDTSNEENNTSSIDANSEDTQKLLKEMAAKMVEEQLAPIKEKLGKAYKERDELAAKASRAEEAAKAAEIKRLEEDGKELEAAQLKISSLTGKLEALEAKNTELTRDRIVSDATVSLDFRNESAKKMAVSEIIAQLVQGEDGTWKHKSGIPIKDFVEHYAKDDEKSFLFKPKNSSGSSSMTSGQASDTTSKPEWTKQPTSQWTTDQMMEAIRKGWLGGGSLEEQMSSSFI